MSKPMTNSQDPMTGLPSTVHSLPIALLRAREGVMAPIRAMLASSDISEQQWRVLRVLAEHGPSDASTVADHACLLFPSLTRIAGAMEKRGLIARHQDKADKRRTVLSMTDAGHAIITQNLDEAVKIARGFEQKLGTANYTTLLSLLSELAASDDP